MHLDGHQADAALYYARASREKGVLTSLDGGALRANTEEVLNYIDVAVVAEEFCAQLKLTPKEALAWLKSRGVKIAAVTEGERGMLWSDEDGVISRMPSLEVPDEKVIDTSGRGRRFPWRLSRVLSGEPHRALGRSFRFRPRRLGLQGAASRQRGRSADA